MAGTPRKPVRPAGPRGKIRLAGTSPTARRVDEAGAKAADANTDEQLADTPEATSATPTPPADVTAPVTEESTPGEAGSPAEAESSPAEAGTPASSDERVEAPVTLDKPAEKSKPKAKGASLKKPATDKAGARRTEPQTAQAADGFLTWRKVTVVAVIAAIFAVFAVVAAFKPGASTQSNTAFIDSSQTSALKAQAGDRICAVLSIDPTKFDDWANKAKTGLTGQALTEFNEYQSTSRDLASQSGQGAECKVDLVAVTNMDGSNATVIATLLISGTQQGVAVLGGPGQARTELGMQKVDGQWLISRISDF
jgi:Mce-associated membrane protein